MKSMMARLIALTRAHRLTGLSVETLRKKMDSGAIRGIRDPAGRRLLLRKDVERLRRKQKRIQVTRPARPMRDTGQPHNSPEHSRP